MILSSLRRPVRWVNLSPDEIISRVAEDCPEIGDTLAITAELVPWCKRQIAEHQAAVLYWLASRLEGDHALEIGTAWGYSASIIAQAMPGASLVTLNPKPPEWALAREYLAPWHNVRVVAEYSSDYLEVFSGPLLDLVFVDGDHRKPGVLADCGWFGWLKVGGLILFHDYSAEDSGRPCPSSKAAIDQFAAGLGREPDVVVIDDRRIGMCGFIRQSGEAWNG